jgi:hypothetical protein
MRYQDRFPNWQHEAQVHDSGLIYACCTFDAHNETLCHNRTGLRINLDDGFFGSPVCSKACKELKLYNEGLVEVDIWIEGDDVVWHDACNNWLRAIPLVRSQNGQKTCGSLCGDVAGDE